MIFATRTKKFSQGRLRLVQDDRLVKHDWQLYSPPDRWVYGMDWPDAEKLIFTGCSKRSRYKAPETGNPPRRGGTEQRLLAKKSRGMRPTLKYAAMTRDEGNAVDVPFSATC
jgi:hypothetical protein